MNKVVLHFSLKYTNFDVKVLYKYLVIILTVFEYIYFKCAKLQLHHYKCVITNLFNNTFLFKYIIF